MPPSDLNIGPDKLLKLDKLLYAIYYSDNYWGRTFKLQLNKYLGVFSTISDPKLYMKKVQSKFIGICTTYVNDTLHSGNDNEDSFILSKKTEERI